jgi:hypothetical protein
MSSNLTSKPGYLSTHTAETGKIEGVDFGWDSNGMWFTGSEGGEGEGGYPVRTSFSFGSEDVCEVIYTVDYQGGCSDQGICVFNVGTEPEWQWGPNETRIACSMNCPAPYIYGHLGEVFGIDSEGGELEGGEGSEYVANYYTFHFTYTPASSQVSVTIYQGEGTNGTELTTLTLNERLAAGDYKVGFSADEDSFGTKAYFTQLNILKNGESMTSASYTYEFSNESPETMPNYRYGGEGNLDTTVYENESGQRVSRQRTGYFEIVNSSGGRKVVEVYDGETVDDTPEVPNVPANPTGNANVSDSGSTI